MGWQDYSRRRDYREVATPRLAQVITLTLQQSTNDETAGFMSENLPTLEERETAVDRLAAHFAQGHLTSMELEHRLDLAYGADTMAQLTSLECGLPALATETRPLPPSVHNLIVSIWGETARRGSWMPARTTTVLTMMGATVLDFREASIETGKIVLQLIAAMGGVKIIVPPGVRVQWSGTALMGSVEESVGMPPAPDSPALSISGFCVMGGVEIIECLPGETPKQARRRRKKARKAHRGDRSPMASHRLSPDC